MENYTQYLVTTDNGKELVKECMCVCVYKWITLLHIWNEYNIINQLYVNINVSII